jgi:uncharacterized repeat protein (TIGR04076 family)
MLIQNSKEGRIPMKSQQDIEKAIQDHLDYTDEEMALFLSNQDNSEILKKMASLSQKTIVAEVVSSQGCNSLHREGDRFYFDAAGNVITSLNPKRMCIYALHSLTPLIYGASEFLYADMDPNTLKFSRAGCIDVGVKCGGWGRIVMELRVEDRKK